MSVNSEIVKNQYLGNGTLATYTFDFKIQKVQDIAVYKKTDLGVSTLLTYSTDYSVAFQVNKPGGTITLLAGNLPTGYNLLIILNPEFKQDAAFDSYGTYYPEAHEKALDRITQYTQVIKDNLKRALQFTVDALYFNPTVPPPTADSALVTNVLGTGLIWAPKSIFKGDQGEVGPPGGVDKFNDRQGEVFPEGGDYTAAQVTFAPTVEITSVTTQAAIEEVQINLEASESMLLGELEGIQDQIDNLDLLPPQASNAGKFLGTNGTVASWQTVDALPSQTGQGGKILGTNGTVASWIDSPGLVVSAVQTLTFIANTITLLATAQQQVRIKGSVNNVTATMPNGTIAGQKVYITGDDDDTPCAIQDTSNIYSNGFRTYYKRKTDLYIWNAVDSIWEIVGA